MQNPKISKMLTKIDENDLQTAEPRLSRLEKGYDIAGLLDDIPGVHFFVNELESRFTVMSESLT
jgi:hypothetical protein